MISEGFGVIVEIPFSLRLVSSLEVRIHINQLSKHSLDFLGYLSSVRLNPSVGIPLVSRPGPDSSDYDIIDRFVRICRNISHYHSGSSKKKNLYRIKYILRLSCARTLARKHKSTVRAF
ncbi:hypothetical protein VitviT2T_002921 [Vitis vinifera]|uniref:Domain X domain-containing protein n=1 Tax=Vitis vinifera TaxID=29760 RepID=A0ABY9BJY0_VITVI|nr:hypothetical protein VitviT2T_002921 [Vitis vinifera]